MKGLLFSQVETSSPGFLTALYFLLSAPPHHCCVTTHKIHDIYHDTSHPFTWQLKIPRGRAGGLIFVFVFLSFSISVTLRYHWHGQKSALASWDRHLQLTAMHYLLRRRKRSLGLQSHLHEEAPPPASPARLTRSHTIRKVLSTSPSPCKRGVWVSNEICHFFANGQIKSDSACSKTRFSYCLWKQPDPTSKQIIVI